MRSLSFCQPLLAAAALCAASLCATPAQAQWPQGTIPDGYSIGIHGSRETYMRPGVTPDRSWLLTFTRTGVGVETVVSNFQTTGTLGAASYPYGIAQSMSPAINSFSGQSWPDGTAYAFGANGGYFFAYTAKTSASPVRYSKCVEMFDAAGSLRTNTAVRIDTAFALSLGTASALTTPDSGAWFAWPTNSLTRGVRLIRLNVDGTIRAPYAIGGWKVPGASLGSSVANLPCLDADGAGSLFVATADTVVRVQHVSADTTLDPGWPVNGLKLSGTLTGSLCTPPYPFVASDATHRYVLFARYVSTGLTPGWDYFVQRFASNGTRDSAWPVNGRTIAQHIKQRVSSESLPVTFQGFPDGSGGVTLTWLDDTLLYAHHLLSTGIPATGYESGPIVLAEIPSWRDPSEPNVMVATCEGHTGGIMATFVDWDHVVHTIWFDGHGAPDPSPELYEQISPNSDLPLDPANNWVSTVAARSDGQGGAYVALDYAPQSANGNLLLQTVFHVSRDWTPASTNPLPPPSHLALSAGPNPGRGAPRVFLSLPSPETAHFALYDINGRVRFTRDLVKGENVVALGEAGALAPGVYLARVTQGGSVATTRIAIIR